MSTLRTDTLQTTDSSVTLPVSNIALNGEKSYDFRKYGIKGDNSTDNTSKFVTLFSDVVAAGGGLVRVPTGNFKVTNLTVPSGVNLVGDGFGNTNIVFTGSVVGDLCQVNSAASVKDIGLTHVGNPAGTVMARLLGNKATINNCQLTNYFIGIVHGTAGIRVIGSESSDCNFFSPYVATGGGGIFAQNVGNATIRNNILSGPTYPAIQPDFGIRVHNADTVFMTDNNVTLHGYALLLDVPAGLNCFALRMSGNLFDSAGSITSGGTIDSALIRPAGNVYDTLGVNNWFGLSYNGCGLRVSATGVGKVDGLFLANNQYVDNSESGFSLESTSCVNVELNGGYASGNTYAGFRVLPNVGEFQFIGLKACDVAGRGANGRGMIVEAGTSNSYLIQGCVIRGNVLSNFTDSGTGLVKQVGNNITA